MAGVGGFPRLKRLAKSAAGHSPVHSVTSLTNNTEDTPKTLRTVSWKSESKEEVVRMGRTIDETVAPPLNIPQDLPAHAYAKITSVGKPERNTMSTKLAAYNGFHLQPMTLFLTLLPLTSAGNSA